VRARSLPFLVAALLGLNVRDALAFESSPQVWGGAFVQADLVGTSTDAPKLIGWFDLHSRRSFDQLATLVRPALGVQLFPGFQVHVGYCHIGRFPDEADSIHEHRLWEQISYQYRLIPTLDLQGRLRFEQRWGEGEGPVGMRIRAMGRIAHYFGDGGPIFLVVFDEAFYALNDTSFGQRAGFDQNRLFAGIGFSGILPKSRFEVGYLGVYLNRADPALDRWDHVPALNLFVSF
jgi:hypothetical protein